MLQVESTAESDVRLVILRCDWTGCLKGTWFRWQQVVTTQASDPHYDLQLLVGRIGWNYDGRRVLCSLHDPDSVTTSTEDSVSQLADWLRMGELTSDLSRSADFMGSVARIEEQLRKSRLRAASCLYEDIQFYRFEIKAIEDVLYQLRSDSRYRDPQQGLDLYKKGLSTTREYRSDTFYKAYERSSIGASVLGGVIASQVPATPPQPAPRPKPPANPGQGMVRGSTYAFASGPFPGYSTRKITA